MTTTAPALERAEGLELLGALGGAGYRTTTYLVRRSDGQTLQLTPLLYSLLECLDRPLAGDELAACYSAAIGRTATVADVDQLAAKLADLGLLRGTETQAPPKSNPLLALRWKVVVSDPATTARLTRPFAALFAPWVMWPVLVAFAGVCWFVLVDKGLASATHEAFARPGLLLAVFALTVLTAGFHELGHAAACRYSGVTPGAMGAGLYLVWPAFYTDVDDAYRLDRRGRLRVDLGGLYFNALAAVAIVGLWLVYRHDALLLGVATQLLQMVRQLAPIVRADGYHILADLTGVPDLFAHLGPTLRRLLPAHWGEPSPLTRRARIIVTAWVAVVVPVLLSMLVTAALVLPRLAATAWVSGRRQLTLLTAHAEQGDLVHLGVDLLRVAALVVPVVATTYLLLRVGRQTGRSAWARTAGRPYARAAALAAGAALLTGLGYAWWPHGQYAPVRADERGTLPALVHGLHAQSVELRPLGRVTLTREPAIALVPRGAAAADHPVLLLTGRGRDLRTVVTTGTGGTSVGRAFPFALPSRPRPGDTQALAVNGTDGTVVYDVAYALVTVRDGAPVRTANTAYALASCRACATVAVSFQVIMVIGHSSVVAPVNAAVAANRSCLQCTTAALAVQLLVSLTQEPTDQVRAQLESALHRLDDAPGLDAETLLARVTQVQAEVLTVLRDSGLVDGDSATALSSAAASPAATAVASSTSSPGAVAASSSPSASPAASAEPSPAESPSAAPSASPESPAASPAPSPS